ncbi:MAG: hypothetical protein ABS81_09030 [Pseudonocardia sp. SCN 72-86]|nr:MAG: hypothetical protein ABS81_09030 [Pseudonocardia sp. SCN 72-86]
MDSVPDDDLGEAETADLFVEPDPVPDAVWSRMLSTAVTDTDADVDDLVPPPGAAVDSSEDAEYDHAGYDAGIDAGHDDPGHGFSEDHAGADTHDWHDGHVDTGTDGGHDGSHDAGWHDGGY